MAPKLKHALRNLYFYSQYLHFSCKTDYRGVVFIFDNKIGHPGLVDRFKAIVGAYYLAKEQGKDFRICFNDDFNIPHYLGSNSHNWSIDNHQIDKSIFHVQLIDYKGGAKGWNLKEGISQYHIYNYLGYNIWNHDCWDEWADKWIELYQELFVPKGELKKYLAKTTYEENTYIAVHIRFLNSLGITEQRHSQKPLAKEEQIRLKKRCFQEIDKLQNESGMRAIVFSDNNDFNREAGSRGFITLKGDVRHISYNHSDETLLKTLSDLYMISRSKKVYSIRGKDLYTSNYPLYGALIGGKPCEKRQIEY